MTNSHRTLLSILLLPATAFASTSEFSFHSTDFQQKVFPKIAGQNCQLERYTLFNTYQESRIADGNSDENVITMDAILETTDPSCIQSYVIVQFIHGCAPTQDYDLKTGTLSEKYFFNLETNRGVENAPMSFPEWAVDSQHPDPFSYAKAPGTPGERLGWYYVADKPFTIQNTPSAIQRLEAYLYNEDNRQFLQDVTRPVREVYLNDAPDGGYYYYNPSYPNIPAQVDSPSLEFKTCVYDIHDVPTSGDPAGPDVPHEAGGPLACFYWNDHFEFNPSSKSFKRITTPGIDDFCANQPSSSH